MKLRTLGGRPAWIILGSALAISMIATALVARADVRSITSDHQSLADGLTRQLARAGHLALVAADRGELAEIARSVVRTDRIIGEVAIYDSEHNPVARIDREPSEPTAAERAAARVARVIGGVELQRRYATRIPPTGEGTPLDPFGTPRADIGRAVLTLSASRWTEEMAATLFRAARLGLFVFAGLALTGFVVAWSVGRPLLRLAGRLRDLSGADTPAPRTDIEGSLEAIGERLTRSEDRARRASEALRSREMELDNARQHAHNAARLRADLVAGMSHELRAPLSAILGHTEMLSRSRLDAEQRDQVATVHKSARNLLSVIDDVLEWSGLESGRATVNEVVGFNLVETIEDTVTLLAPMAFEKDLELVHLIYQDVPLRLRGDPLRFQQILTNLVSNAIKFTERGSVIVRAMLEEEYPDSVRLRVSVTDTGPGIDPADRQRLFGMYERLSSHAGQGGSGLGLAISKRLLEMMGGHIDVDSPPEGGSEFYFVLPLQKALHREQRVIPWAGLHGKRIWLADTFPAARKALAHHLESWNILSVEMDSYTELRAALGAGRPDVPPPDALILGLRSGDISDADVIAALGHAEAAGIPALALATSIDNRTHERLKAAGAMRSLPKSINRLRLYRELCEITGAEAPQSQSEGLPLADVQALVADDSPASQRYMAALLTELGARVAVADDGDAAIAAWHKGAFPLVLLDDRMPGTCGVEAAGRIRAMASEAALPVIIGVTADGTGDAATRFRDAGAADCLIKPFDENDIIRRVVPLLSAAPQPQSAGHGERLAADPKMAAMLARELPEQVAAVTAALADRDPPRGREAIHTLHGTAAFYGLDTLKSVAGRLEQTLIDGDLPSDEDIRKLRNTADRARGDLEGRAGERAADSG